MVVKSYEQMTDVSIMEVKTYLLIHSDGIYQQDIYDLMNTCIDVFQQRNTMDRVTIPVNHQCTDPFRYLPANRRSSLEDILLFVGAGKDDL